MNIKVRIYTFGCKVNQYNSALIQSNLEENNILTVQTDPDYIIINMCSLTENAVRKTRLLLNRIKREYEGIPVILTGCIEDHNDFDVDYVVHAREKEKIYEIFGIEKFTSEIKKFQGRTRAFIMIQEGCDNFCSYCIVPFLRNRIESKNIEDVKREIENISKSGFKEIVLTGTHINRYNSDGKTLKNIVEIINKTTEIERFRISSIEPDDFDEEFFETIQSSPKFCPHLHLSIQSGSDKILKLMKRKYNSQFAGNLITKLNKIENFEWTGDIITGFPGEEQAEYQETLNFIKKYKPVSLHVFPFSARKKTEAWDMENKIPVNVRKDRAAELRELVNEIKIQKLKEYKGKILEVLFENSRDGYYNGYSENYIKVCVKNSNQKIINKITKVKITGVNENNLTGDII
ncbi:MAG: tRNA (N(6)-L-threonylcarbamoyladenosine(37)-C(2))-methylthiotransferase MtaB [Candidatus Muiribacteriota bacterium]